MRTKHLTTMAVAALIVTASCQKDQVQGPDGLNANGLAYTPVTETPTIKAINSSNLEGPAGSADFDWDQTWFDFTTISTAPGQKGWASERTAWHLGFYSQTGNIRVNGTSSNLLAYLNYSVNTQGKQITSIGGLGNADLTSTVQTEISNAVTNFFNGGTFGMGDLSTYDFHREGQFVIGTPATNSDRFYLIRTAGNVQVHPDDPATSNLFIVSIHWTGSAYQVSHRALNSTGTDWVGSALDHTITKNSNYQSRFLTFGTPNGVVNDDIQPQLSDWNLGLSAVMLKRYINPSAGGGAYPFALKGVVLNNNPAVQVYRVQTTADTAGAPGPYDPNYSWQNDPALAPANDITVDFDNFTAANIDDSKFSGNSQEEIGQYYRYLDMGNYNVFVDRFYVIKLQNGDVYKLRFLPLGAAGTSSPVNNGIRIKYAKIATTP